MLLGDVVAIWSNIEDLGSVSHSSFLNRLLETKEHIGTADIRRSIVSRKFKGLYCEIAVSISMKNSFLSLFVEIQENFFHLIEGPHNAKR